MSIKVYNKKGRLDYKESKMVKEIQEAIDAKLLENPNLREQFNPATNSDELKQLHLKYCGTDVEFEDVPNTEEQHKEFRDSMKETVEEVKPKETSFDDSSFIDPFNDANPVVRDYVMDNNFDSSTTQDNASKGNFDNEPTTFKDAFTMPDDNTPTSPSGGGSSKKQPKEEPLNPSYNDQNSGRKKRTNKKFAKYIVEAVCMLAERGFVWWTTNKITETKLAEYELNNEMDLTLLVSMPNGQEATVRQFFKSHCIQAEQLAKYEKEEKEDLAEVLAELLDKKGVTPSIEQEAAIIALQMFGKKFMIGYEMNRGINGLLSQLKEMQKGAPKNYTAYDEQPQQQPQPQPQQEFNQEQNTIVSDIEGNFAGMTDIQDVAIIE
jgi:hypothetical protein